jgi:hypothetical protein
VLDPDDEAGLRLGIRHGSNAAWQGVYIDEESHDSNDALVLDVNACGNFLFIILAGGAGRVLSAFQEFCDEHY